MTDLKTAVDVMARAMTRQQLADLPADVAEFITVPGGLNNDQITGVLQAAGHWQAMNEAAADARCHVRPSQ